MFQTKRSIHRDIEMYIGFLWFQIQNCKTTNFKTVDVIALLLSLLSPKMSDNDVILTFLTDGTQPAFQIFLGCTMHKIDARTAAKILDTIYFWFILSVAS